MKHRESDIETWMRMHAVKRLPYLGKGKVIAAWEAAQARRDSLRREQMFAGARRSVRE